MEEFFEALKNFEISEIIPAYKKIEKHLESGYITNDDYFFLEYCHPLVKMSCERTKKIIEGGKND